MAAETVWQVASWEEVRRAVEGAEGEAPGAAVLFPDGRRFALVKGACDNHVDESPPAFVNAEETEGFCLACGALRAFDFAYKENAHAPHPYAPDDVCVLRLKPDESIAECPECGAELAEEGWRERSERLLLPPALSDDMCEQIAMRTFRVAFRDRGWLKVLDESGEEMLLGEANDG